MLRYEIINKLIEKHGYESYLEIGTQGDVCLSKVRCGFKVGVDPDPVLHEEQNSDEFYQMSSDEFFAQNARFFDIIFIDGKHENAQAKRDIHNSLQILNPGGAVVVHDCNPQEEINQRVPMPHVGSWNGDVWRAWVWFRHLATLEMVVVDTDEGCGIIKKGWQSPLTGEFDISFDEFAERRKELLNLISVEEWLKSINA